MENWNFKWPEGKDWKPDLARQQNYGSGFEKWGLNQLTQIPESGISITVMIITLWTNKTNYAHTCYISMSLNKQLIFCETSTEKECVNRVASFVHAFNYMTRSMLTGKWSIKLILFIKLCTCMQQASVPYANT